MKKDDYRVPASSCPDCHIEHDAAFGPDSDGECPKPGDISVCVACQGLSVFGDDLKRRKPTEADIEDWPLELITRYQKALKTVKSLADI